MLDREHRPLLAAALLGLALAACVAAGVLHSDMLGLLPVVLLAVPLLAGRYVGEEQLLALASRLRRPVRRRPRALRRPRRRAVVLPVRGGALLAAGLAERGPPAPSAC